MPVEAKKSELIEVAPQEVQETKQEPDEVYEEDLTLRKTKGFTLDDIITVKDWEKRMNALNYSSE
jgi:hypothetical protein